MLLANQLHLKIRNRLYTRILQFLMFHWPIVQIPLGQFPPKWPMRLHWQITIRRSLSWPIKPPQILGKLLQFRLRRTILHLLYLLYPPKPRRRRANYPHFPNHPHLLLLFHHLTQSLLLQSSHLKCNPVRQIMLVQIPHLRYLLTWPLSSRSLHNLLKTPHWPMIKEALSGRSSRKKIHHLHLILLLPLFLLLLFHPPKPRRRRTNHHLLEISFLRTHQPSNPK